MIICAFEQPRLAQRRVFAQTEGTANGGFTENEGRKRGR